MEDDRRYVGPQEAMSHQMPHGAGRPMMQGVGGLGMSHGTVRGGGIGLALDELCVEAEQLMITAAQLLDVLQPVLRAPQPSPEMARQPDHQMVKSGYQDRIYDEILKVRRAKLTILDAMERLDL